MSTNEKGILLVQLGSPDSPDPKDVKIFLKKFLSDPRLIENQNLGWKIILNCFILTTRPKKVAEAYKSIWKDGTFPLFKNTEDFSTALQKELDCLSEDYQCKFAYIIGKPNIAQRLKEFHTEGIKDIRVIYMYPQYAVATTLSARDALEAAIDEVKLDIKIEKVESFNENPAYIENQARAISDVLKKNPVEKLLISFHGYPLKRIFAGDPYFDQCVDASKLLVERIEGIDPENIILCFQSQFGRDEWLAPATDKTIEELAKSGVKSIAISSPAFVADNLETDEELGIEAKEIFLEHGGENFYKIDSLNADEQWAKDFSKELVQKDVEQIVKLDIPKETPLYVPEQKYKSEPLSEESKKSLKSVFIVLLLDLIGFSIIFPLFPGMLEYYGKTEGTTGLYGYAIQAIDSFRGLIGGTKSNYDAVLFGGLLGSIYSLLQFMCAPIIGSLSDRYGRKPVIQISVLGIAISYLCWFFADAFALLVFARLLGGVMSGNISTATAVVSDVTTKTNRSKGMAIIGIAFGLGFVIGPAIGAFSTLIDLSALSPTLDKMGVNPYSMPALIALCLSLYNFYYIHKNFKETLTPEIRNREGVTRSINPLKLFKVDKYPGVFLNNMIYFYFLLSFSGVEFTLTFLTYERLRYTDINQGLMFLYIGFVLVIMQGGYVRRKASVIGEKVMAKRGLICLIPALILMGFAQNTFILLISLTFLACGSAQVIPCLTALTSRYAPEEEQGRITGVFRSLGALARACGPIFACTLYWKLGSDAFYYLGAAFLILPILLIAKLPEPAHD